jgi:hypothetical protein
MRRPLGEKRICERDEMPIKTKFSKYSEEELSNKIIKEFSPEYRKESIVIRKELLSESPRASVLVGAAWLDNYLSELIQISFPEDEIIRKVVKEFIPNFSQRIIIANKLGIIGDNEKKVINIIRDIRNKFAHRAIISFKDEDVIQLTNKLNTFLPPGYSPDENPDDEQRSKYIAVISVIVSYLFLRIKRIKTIKEYSMRLDLLRSIAKKMDEQPDKFI